MLIWYTQCAAGIRPAGMTSLWVKNHSPTVSATTRTKSAIIMWAINALENVSAKRFWSPLPNSNVRKRLVAPLTLSTTREVYNPTIMVKNMRMYNITAFLAIRWLPKSIIKQKSHKMILVCSIIHILNMNNKPSLLFKSTSDTIISYILISPVPILNSSVMDIYCSKSSIFSTLEFLKRLRR